MYENSVGNSGQQTAPASQSLVDTFNGLMHGDVSDATSDLIIKGGTALLMLLVTYFVAKFSARWVSALLCKRIDVTLGKFAGKLAFYSIVTVAGLAILQTAGVSITSFAAILAAAGFAIGLAFQGTLSNFSAGILLLVFRPFKVGDLVSAAGITGKVYEIDLFTTIFDTPDNRRLIVPNSSIAGTTIENITYHKQRRVDVTVGVSYAASIDDTRAVLAASAEALSTKLIPGEGRGYQVILSNLGASSVDWTVRFWAATADYLAVKEALTVEIKRQLDANQIVIPFPQMQLHISESVTAGERQQPRHEGLPTPNLNPLAGHGRGLRIRPRVRGENA